jgi:putative membrane protein
MSAIARLLVGALAALHAYILYVEMFRWTAPATLEAFAMSPEFAESTKVIAANQGLYNGFLAAGLAWSIFAPPVLARSLALYFAACVIVAGLYGGLTATPRILFVQGLPGLLAFAAVLASPRAKLR